MRVTFNNNAVWQNRGNFSNISNNISNNGIRQNVQFGQVQAQPTGENPSRDKLKVQTNDFIKAASGDKTDSPLFNEIMEQPVALRRLLANFPKNFAALKLPAEIQRLILLGEGSSYNAPRIAAPYLSHLTDAGIHIVLPANSKAFIKLRNSEGSKLTRALLVATSQSGRSTSTLRSIEQFATIMKNQDQPFAFVPMTNNADGTMAKTYGNHVDISAGPENAIAATKSMTNTIASLLLLGVHLAKTKNPEKASNLQKQLEAIPDKLEKFLNDPRVHQRLRALAQSIATENRFVVLSSNPMTPILTEAGLKLTETTESWVKTDNMESFKHGPKVVLGQNPATIYLVPPALKSDEATTFYNDVQEHFKINNAKNFPSNKMFFINYQNGPEVPKALLNKYQMSAEKNVMTLPHSNSFKDPLECQFLGLVTFQLLSYYLALAKNLNPNHGALSKVVTQ